MRSQARFTYTRVAAHLEGRDPLARGPQARLAPVIDCLHQVYRALRKEREKRGALDFEAPEVKVLVDAAGNPTEIRAYPRNDAHRLIEECMIAANVQAAGFLKKHKLPALFRIHGKPDEERIEELKRFLSMRGVLLEIGGDLKPARLQKVLAGISGRPDAAVLENAIIRSLPQALYQPLNIGHFGLALAEYAHFTSPIRRYPDLLVHRGIRHALGGGTAANFVHSAREMEALGTECSLRERRADEAARSVVAWLKCEYMRPRIGEEFDAVVTGVTDFGLFVQLKDDPGRRSRARHRAACGLLPLPRGRPHAGRRAHAPAVLDRRRAQGAACKSGFRRAQDRLRARRQDRHAPPSAPPRRQGARAPQVSGSLVYGLHAVRAVLERAGRTT